MGTGIKTFFFRTLRIIKYQLLSTCNSVTGKPILYYPLLLNGQGSISFGKSVQNGVINSPGFYSGYNYIEARYKESKIIIGNNVSINNGFSAIAYNHITIDNNVLFGINCRIEDSDGHVHHPHRRNDTDVPSAPVHIQENVFLGSGVTILKGVTIGRNSIIGSNSVVTKSIPDNVIAAGNPAKVIRNL